MRLLVSIMLFAALTMPSLGQPKPSMRLEDKVRIREAVAISKQYGERIWKGFADAPFALDLVADSIEFLVNDPSPSQDFTPLGYDSVVGSQVYFRKAVFDKHFLATFPAVNGINTIVVGTPENTGIGSTAWIITVLHEHFHQYVYSSPNYYPEVKALDLAGGDTTGMWMLHFPFPYADSAVVDQYTRYVQALVQAMRSIGTDSFASRFKTYAGERTRFQQLLKPAAYRYFSFQIWQEGIARYTEYKFLELLDQYEPAKEVLNLADFLPFRAYRTEMFNRQLDRLTNWNLSEHRRDCFYAIGFAEGLLLDKLNAHWRERYLSDKFHIEHYSTEYR